MVDVAQLVRALDCGSRCRGFESHLPPQNHKPVLEREPVFSSEIGLWLLSVHKRDHEEQSDE